jgi:putative protease
MVELLAPAGNFEKLKVAFHYGADAVYAGLDKLSLRANADNFTREELAEAVKYTHEIGKKIYIALNIYFMPEHTERIIDALTFLAKIKPDGMIISDMGVFYLAKKYAPEIPVHISTQANCTNQYAATMYSSIGANRVVLAREVDIEGIKEIRKELPSLELEAFIHGAMCIAYSGRCLLSSYMTTKGLGTQKEDGTRSANQGDCAHSCRWEFFLKEKTRENDTFDVSADENGTYILSSKDICMVEHVKDLIDAGVSSFKIEGRMKSILYISSIVRAYRYVIDCILSGKSLDKMEQVYHELDVVSHREFSTGFFYKKPWLDANIASSAEYKRNTRLAAMVLSTDEKVNLKIYNKITQNDKLVLIGKNMKTVPLGNIQFFDKHGNPATEAKHTEPFSAILYDIDGNIIKPEEMDILRMESNF